MEERLFQANGVNVVARYFFGSPFSWAEELMLFLMIFGVFAGGIAVTWRNQHIRIETIIERAPIACAPTAADPNPVTRGDSSGPAGGGARGAGARPVVALSIAPAHRHRRREPGLAPPARGHPGVDARRRPAAPSTGAVTVDL